ncbi:MAG: glutamate--tRNA ligase [Microbacteriaceae bacterium]|nr:glutamate--tRNA ligase [Microbacteriaceae bacterium]
MSASISASAIPFSQAQGADIRVRFCPSPTGIPHVGMARTALFNWAYARHTGGTFIFRIEDTDSARDSEESYQQLVEALEWLGLNWDEGVEKGGPHEPYRQSQRTEIYKDIIARLVEGGYVYESYSTPEEIEARNVAAGRAVQLGYDNYDRDLSEEQIAAFKAEGRSPALRLRVPDVDYSFTDLVRGEITFPAGSLVDFVLVRPNGEPLYTFVNPVDDALMGITHVLRGEDLLSSTPRQIALYLALIEIGVASFVPQFGHLPYVMGEGNKKLSKRDPESNLFLHRERGFIPEGLVNYLALLGWSISADRDIFTAAEMAEAFDVKNVNPNPARFDLKKAEAINAHHLRALSEEDFAERVTPYLINAGLVGEEPRERELEIIRAGVPLIQPRSNLLGEAVPLYSSLLSEEAAPEIAEDAWTSLPENAGEVIVASIEALSALDDFNTEAIKVALEQKLIEELGLKPRIAFGPVRVALSGQRISPPLFESMEIIGKDLSLARLQALKERL